MPKAKAAPLVPPVVTIMGHVDHGKTTLLDYIRHTNVTAGEAGGITQHIGAYQIDHQGRPITFIDTPGHAAFSKMRARGASVTDIVVLVVAADDGVKPQTKESIRHIKQANVPTIVAVNKIDIKSAIPEMAKAQLVEEGIAVEGYGGDVPVVEISAKTGQNVEKLLETILALAEMEELSSDPTGPLQAVTIEAQLEKNLGPVATLLVREGTLKSGQDLVSVGLPVKVTGRVKRMVDDKGNVITSAPPSTPVKILGLKAVPPAGTLFTLPGFEAEVLASSEPTPPPSPAPSEPSPEPSPEPAVNDTLSTDASPVGTAVTPPAEPEAAAAEEEEKPHIKIILLADTHGSLEAITQNLTEEIEIIKSATGEVDESDVLLAQTTQAAIIAFQAPVSRSAKKLAQTEKVPIHHYSIIYELLEDFQTQILKLLEPTIDEEELGVAEVKETFDMKGQHIAGCRIKSGKLSLKDRFHLKRNEKFITDGTIVSLKQGKVDVNQVEADQECGVITKPPLHYQPGDLLIAFKKLEEK